MSEGGVRHLDPSTSREAARLVNTTRGEEIVWNDLNDLGPMTMEEVGNLHNKPSDHLGPRFVSLEEKRMIKVSTHPNGGERTRSGRSGRQRRIYEVQPDKSLWRPRVRKISSAQKRVIALEAALRAVKSVSGNSKIHEIIDEVLL